MLSLVLGIVLLIVVLSQFPIGDVFDKFKEAKLIYLLYYLLSVFGILFFATLRWYNILLSQKVNINFWRLFAYRLVGSAMSYLTPGPKVGGEFFQSAAMRKEKISFTQRLSSIVIDRTVELSSSGFFFIIGAIVGVAFLPFNLDFGTRAILISVCIVALYLIYLFFKQVFSGKSVFHSLFRMFKLHRFKKLEKYEQKVIDFERYVIDFYSRDRKHFFISIALTFFTWIGMFAEYYFLLKMFGVSASLLSIFMVVSFVGLAYLLPMPMALGTLEAGQVSAFAIIQASTAIGIGVALIIRAKDIILSLIGVFFMGMYGIKVDNTGKEEKKAEYVRSITKIK